ncbi:sensor domain-containing diguanylate cyclase [Pseudomonas azerbaijanorientalis]|uniref:sensor domain-containing diguanylate cyclase n=1 Tax=Pseudomonas azerbaijanorientalis TaxID=2842350 RepID=UPI001C3D42C6|nr:sensor domain-containing diguanylate cyclase [Pseudomonas azerbaijanorientalis]QXH64050.1 sensor domain-containing diguanylate cyclase [Pseudomonas azerbaijanorientalis]
MKRDTHLVVLLLLFIGCSLASLTVWKVLASRDRALEDVNVHGLNLTQALATYSEGIVRQSSLLLLGLVERLETEGSGPIQIRRLSALVNRQQPLMPQLSGITIYDNQGRWLMSSNRPIPAGANSSDRAYFIHHRDDPSREILIGPPIQSRSNQEWVITVSRRFNDARGEFAGVVAVTLGIENFLRLFGKIDVGQEGAIGLSYTDGTLLARYPFREQDMGRNFSKSPIYAKYLVDRSVGTASFTSSLDGVERLYAFQKSDKLPLITTVALGKREALTAWRMEALLSAVVVTGLLGLTGLIGWLLILDIRRRTKVEGQLRGTQEQLLSSNRQLELLAMKDALTGLANRRYFDVTLAMEARRAQREGTSLALLMIDIDYFKLFNDSKGHVAGDFCLQSIGKVVEECVRRPSDLVARYGGEEMGVIMPNTDIDGAQVVAQLILRRLKEESISHEASPLGRVSVSIGIATAAGSRLDQLQSLIEAADQALYSAKTLGRNQFATHCKG